MDNYFFKFSILHNHQLDFPHPVKSNHNLVHNLCSAILDQWDWEKVVTKNDRNLANLVKTVDNGERTVEKLHIKWSVEHRKVSQTARSAIPSPSGLLYKRKILLKRYKFLHGFFGGTVLITPARVCPDMFRAADSSIKYIPGIRQYRSAVFPPVQTAAIIVR